MKASTFLRGLWGDVPPGLIQVVVRNSGWRTTFIRACEAADVIATPGRPDVYTGVGTALRDLGKYRRGGITNIGGLAGLWLDIDVNGGPDHITGRAPSKTEALELAGRHADPTVIVDSGYGLHAWYVFQHPWMFTSEAEREHAREVAAQWYELHRKSALADGWTIDGTSDISRLLRLPGTTNAKGGAEVPVDALEHRGDRHHRQDLEQLAATVGPVTVSSGAGAGLPDLRPVDGSGLSGDRLALLFEASPEFADTFHHRRRVGDGSLSSYDMSLASQAASFMTDQEIAELIARHRLHHDPTDGKHRRVKYLQTTIAKARQQATRDSAQQQLRSLAARARTRSAAA
jgi:hypothetical protein